MDPSCIIPNVVSHFIVILQCSNKKAHFPDSLKLRKSSSNLALDFYLSFFLSPIFRNMPQITCIIQSRVPFRGTAHMLPNISKLMRLLKLKQPGNLLSTFKGIVYPPELHQKAILANYSVNIEMLALPPWVLALNCK